MKVSILMCSYNAAEFIDRTLQCIIGQTYKNWELLISDDCSTDNTLELLEKYLDDPRVKLFIQPENLGYVKNKNWLFMKASGDLITQQDCDDTSDLYRMEKQVQVFRQNPEVMICGTNYNRITPSDTLNEPTKEYAEDFIISGLQLEYPFWFPGLMFRRELITEFGLFSEYFAEIYGDDHHWVFRVNQKYPIWFLAEALYNYRIHPLSITRLVAEKCSRKAIVAEILEELYDQRVATGTDYIDTGEEDKMKEFENWVLNNRRLMSEKTRVLAAVAIDNNDMASAGPLLRRAFRLDITNLKNFKTMCYFLKRKYFRGRTLMLKQFLIVCSWKGIHLMKTDTVATLLTENCFFTGI
jgi:glycosyltransferase involved in cell wall biosynthesis